MPWRRQGSMPRWADPAGDGTAAPAPKSAAGAAVTQNSATSDQPVMANPPVGENIATLNVDPLGAAAIGTTVIAFPPAGTVVAM